VTTAQEAMEQVLIEVQDPQPIFKDIWYQAEPARVTVLIQNRSSYDIRHLYVEIDLRGPISWPDQVYYQGTSYDPASPISHGQYERELLRKGEAWPVTLTLRAGGATTDAGLNLRLRGEPVMSIGATRAQSAGWIVE